MGATFSLGPLLGAARAFLSSSAPHSRRGENGAGGRRSGRVWTTITCLDLRVRCISGRTNSPGRPFLLLGSPQRMRRREGRARNSGSRCGKRRNAKAQVAVVTTSSKLLVSAKIHYAGSRTGSDSASPNPADGLARGLYRSHVTGRVTTCSGPRSPIRATTSLIARPEH